jgi:DNA polymerase-3 subunit delta'
MLRQMIHSGKIPQTLLLDGPEGVGKATLARRFAAALLGWAERIEQDDLSLPAHQQLIADREKWTSEKRNEEPLFFSSHPDFVTFPPDGPLRQLTIAQMRLLREQARFAPVKGARRVFLIDRMDQANEQAANSLLKTLEEPPGHLILIMTAQNAYDLLPTIRSRAVRIRLSALSEPEMREFLATRRDLTHADRRLVLAQGAPGAAVSLDLEVFDRRRTAMLALLKAASGRTPFASWIKYSEALGPSKADRLDDLARMLYSLLEDVLLSATGLPPRRHADISMELLEIARAVPFHWIRAAVKRTDDLPGLARRNAQKSLALDAFAVDLAGLLKR